MLPPWAAWTPSSSPPAWARTAASQRLDIASGLEFMGVKMDAEANNVRGKEAVISAADSKVKVLLIPTNEELMIAMDTAAIVKG